LRSDAGVGELPSRQDSSISGDNLVTAEEDKEELGDEDEDEDDDEEEEEEDEEDEEDEDDEDEGER
jgi:hypothetical protein